MVSSYRRYVEREKLPVPHLYLPGQCFSIGTNFPPYRHLTTSGDIYIVTTVGRGGVEGALTLVSSG